MSARRIPVILARRFTSYAGAGDFETLTMDVSAFAKAELFVWRGPVVNGGSFGVRFEEAGPDGTWVPCAGN